MAPRAVGVEYADDPNRVMRCIVCTQTYDDLEAHLKIKHPNLSVTDYMRSVPGFDEQLQLAEISEEEAAAHPAGAEGARIKNTLRMPSERDYYDACCQRLVAEGFPITYLLAALAYQMVVAARYRAQLEDETKRGARDNSPALSAALATAETRIRDLYRDLRGFRKDKIEEATSTDQLNLVESELRLAEKWVIENQGEFEESCPRCGQMLTAPSLPHWAYEPIRLRDNSLIWPVWSRELWRLMMTGQMRLWQMAYVLRTSPEGLRVTAGRRGEKWPEDLDIELEEAELRKILDQDDREALLADRALLPPRKTGPLS